MKQPSLKTYLGIGYLIGVVTMVVINVILSFLRGGEVMVNASAELVALLGNDLHAAILQYVIAGFLGMAWAGASAIFGIESWSLARRTVVHALIMFPVMLAVALGLRWIPVRLAAILSFLAIVAIIYVVMWLTQYLIIRKNVEDINQKLAQR